MPRARSILLSVAAVLAVFGPPASGVASQHSCKGQEGVYALPYDSAPPPGYEHDRFDTEPKSRMFSYGPFTSSFETPEDERRGSPYRAVPKWVSYEMHAMLDADGRPRHAEGATRPRTWYELEQTSFLWIGKDDVHHRGINASYVGFAREWNRGHLAARSHANRLGWQEGCNTHVFVNAVPQDAAMNQGDWEALENYAIALANKSGRAWTIAGPIFYPDRPVERIGRSETVGVAVPHALFKVLAIEVNGRVEARAFVFRQDDEAIRHQYRRCSGTAQEAYDFSVYAVPMAEVEAQTGLHFFQALPAEQRRVIGQRSAAPLWPVEARYFDQRCGGRSDDDE
jgi:hypothetical protein